MLNDKTIDKKSFWKYGRNFFYHYTIFSNIFTCWHASSNVCLELVDFSPGLFQNVSFRLKLQISSIRLFQDFEVISAKFETNGYDFNRPFQVFNSLEYYEPLNQWLTIIISLVNRKSEKPTCFSLISLRYDSYWTTLLLSFHIFFAHLRHWFLDIAPRRIKRPSGVR